MLFINGAYDYSEFLYPMIIKHVFFETAAEAGRLKTYVETFMNLLGHIVFVLN